MAEMMALAWIMGAFALIVLTSIVTVILVARALYKRVRRSRMLNAAVLRTRATLSWGAQHDVLRLRIRLNETLDSGKAAIDLAALSEGPRGELPRLFRRIQSAASTVDAELRFMESETDPAALAEWLPVLQSRVDQVAAIVRRLRSAVASGLSGLSDENLVMLRADVDREVDALRAGMQELHSLSSNDQSYEPQPQPSAARLNTRNQS
ncbi:hypothetical protein ACPPVQ_19620 [Diaminobutyricibacter sp. McL0618]|uniref:hypothetical protein n=1 Tax=Leifsonia sp. McL0618 TaxID=3415677 RepID=UPI003CE93827